MRFALVVISCLVLAACGGQAAPADIAQAFDQAGVALSERELNDGRTAWSSDTNEDVVVELVESQEGEEVEEALVAVPALQGDGGDYPGSRYVAVLDEQLADGLADWIAEERSGRSSGSWSSTRDFGGWSAEIDNDTEFLQSFTVSLKRNE